MSHDRMCPATRHLDLHWNPAQQCDDTCRRAFPCQCAFIAAVREDERNHSSQVDRVATGDKLVLNPTTVALEGAANGGGGGSEEESSLAGIVQKIYDTFTVEQAAIWLNSPNAFLGGATPRDALHAGRLDDVGSALRGFSSGVYA